MNALFYGYSAIEPVLVVVCDTSISSAIVLEIALSVFLFADLISNLRRSMSLGSEFREEPTNFCLRDACVSSYWLTGEYTEVDIVSSET